MTAPSATNAASSRCNARASGNSSETNGIAHLRAAEAEKAAFGGCFRDSLCNAREVVAPASEKAREAKQRDDGGTVSPKCPSTGFVRRPGESNL